MSRRLFGCIVIVVCAFSAVRADDTEKAKRKLESIGVRPIARDLFDNIEKGNLEVVSLLLAAGMSVETLSDLGYTGVLFASQNGQKEIVKLFVEHKADLEKQDRIFGRTALMHAAEKGHFEIVKLLLEQGANVNARSVKRLNFGIVYPAGETALMYAAARGDDRILQLLLDSGANPALQNEKGESAVAWASKASHTKILQMLEAALQRQNTGAGDNSAH